MDPALLLAGVGKRYGPRPILRAVDLAVAPRETVALLGPNGSGKTTLLRIAATIARPDAGRVVVGGVDARRFGELARARLAYAPQNAPVYAELTVAEHLAWWGRLRGARVERADVERALADAGLARMSRERGVALSRGQRQRLVLAMSFLGDPPLLLLDEPFTGLDGEGQEWLEARLAARRGSTATLVAWHDADAARRLADRRLRLADGRLEASA